MLAAHHRPNNPTGKRLGLPHSHFEKTQLTDSTIYNVQPLKNRRFSSPVAKDGLVNHEPVKSHSGFGPACVGALQQLAGFLRLAVPHRRPGLEVFRRLEVVALVWLSHKLEPGRIVRLSSQTHPQTRPRRNREYRNLI